jgi:predicted Zn-dependent protease
LAEITNAASKSLVGSPGARVEDSAQAIDLASQAVALEPSFGEYAVTLGEAHYRTGDWQAARDALAKATSLESSNSGAWFLLAMAEWQLRDEERARECQQEALRLIGQNGFATDQLNRLRAEAAALIRPAVARMPNGPEAFVRGASGPSPRSQAN